MNSELDHDGYVPTMCRAEDVETAERRPGSVIWLYKLDRPPFLDAERLAALISENP